MVPHVEHAGDECCRCAMLFVTVLAAPVRLAKMNFVELFGAVLLGVAYVVFVVKLAVRYASQKA
jgi:hypothetical protein